MMWVLLVAAAPVFAQTRTEGKPEAKPAAEASAAKPGKKPAKPKPSPAAHAALQAAKGLAAAVKTADLGSRPQAMTAAAQAYEKVAIDFAVEPIAAAQALFAAGELWRRQGSLPQAEKDFLSAAGLDPADYGQRATLEAADVQRRGKQLDKALVTYGQVVTMDSGTARAEEARLWQGRLLQGMGRLDEAAAAFQTAVANSSRPRQLIEASNFLAKALIQKGDFAAAERAIEHAEVAAMEAADGDETEAERLKKALEDMSAKKALQKARDKQDKPAKDARALEDSRRGKPIGDKPVDSGGR
jgi:tetratricopeptide (TPR) repeat protein